MAKQRKQLLSLVAVLIVLVCGFFGLQYYNQWQGELSEKEESGIIIEQLNSDEIVRLIYTYEGEEYSFEKQEDTWYATDNHDIAITQYRLDNMVSSVAPMEAVQIIENASDISQYGLDEPSRRISLETAQAVYTYYVGDYNSMSGIYYVCRPEESTVYTVEAAAINGLNYTLEDVTEDTTEETENPTEGTGEVGNTKEATENTGNATAATSGEAAE